MHAFGRYEILTPINNLATTPRPCEPSSFYNDFRMCYCDNLLARRPTDFADSDEIKTTRREGEGEGVSG